MKKTAQRKIVLAGGGTGGHLAPLRALVPYMQEKNPEISFIWIGATDFEKQTARDLGIGYRSISGGKLRRYFSFKNFIDGFKVIVGCIQSFFLLIKIRPRIVVSSGGFVSVPVVVAAWLLRIPVVTHEQTITFGLANKINAFFSTKIALAFHDSVYHIPTGKRSRAVVVGNPVRQSLMGGSLEGAQKHFGINFNDDVPVFFVTGGSQGALAINSIIAEILPELLEKMYVIHQAGKQGIEAAQKIKDVLPPSLRNRYFPVGFIKEEFAHIYAVSDLVLARSGAGTVNELYFFEIPSILVPLEPTRGDEQTKNAKWLQSHSGQDVILLRQQYMSTSSLMGHVQRMMAQSQNRGFRRHTDLPIKTDESVVRFSEVVSDLLG